MHANAPDRGYRGQVPVEVEPDETITPHGRIRAFVTETGAVVAEPAPGRGPLRSDGYAFLACYEFDPRAVGGVVGPYETVARPEGHRHERESAAREAVSAALHAAAARFVMGHEAAVLQLATEHLRSRIVAEPEPGGGPAAEPPVREAAFPTPYGPVLARVTAHGAVEVTGAGFQGSIVADGRILSLSGTLPFRKPDPADRLPLRLVDVFERERSPNYHWDEVAPDLRDLADAIHADPEMAGAMRARRSHDLAASEHRDRVAARAALKSDLGRLTARLDSLPEDPAPSAPGR